MKMYIDLEHKRFHNTCPHRHVRSSLPKETTESSVSKLRHLSLKISTLRS